MTPICIPIFINATHDWLTEIRAAEAALAGTSGMIELRADTATPDQLLAALAAAKLPVIVTIRPTWEGGLNEKSFEDRAAMFAQAASAGAAYIDLELESWKQSAAIREMAQRVCQQVERNSGPQLIISSHDFSGRPDVEGRIAELATIQIASVLKIAWRASSVIDAIDALRLVDETRRKHGRPLLALAMGEFGQLSRLLGAKFKQPFTFASTTRGSESAPGQPTVRDIRDLYQFQSQKPGSPTFGVIGWPVGHSLSPHIHNAGFRKIGFDGIYVPLPIEPAYDQFAAVIDALRHCPGMNLHGLSVTIPHKENAFRYVTQCGGNIDDLSRRIGAINTLVWNEDDSLRGFNSDYAGSLDALISAWGSAAKREDLAGKRIAVIGAGGAARAIVAGLAAYGATVVIYNRTEERAAALAADFNGHTGKVVAAPWGKLCSACCDAYINCTPLGMHPHIDASPIVGDPAWTPDTVVFDTVYNPLSTKFLQLAETKGAKTIPGTEMFIRQAAVQFEAFTGQPAPIDVFRKVLLEKLSVAD